jgi:hypothetical protein
MTFGDLKSSTSSTPGSPSSRSIKIVWQEEIRRLPFNAVDLQALKDICVSCFGIKNQAGLIFTYEDAEGDTVTLSTIEELCNLVEASPATIKLSLQRKLNKNKAQSQQAQHQQPEVVVPSKEESAVEKKNANKKQWKEKKQQLKKEIVHSKVVRIRWRTSETPAATTSTGEEKKKKNNEKGCFVGVNPKGKVKFGAGSQGKKGLWLIHELSNGDIILAPLSSPKSHLRVFPDGRTNLTKRGAGPRARWSLLSTSNTISLSAIGSTEKIRLASRFVPDFQLGVVQEFNKKSKPVLRAKGLNASATSLASEFTLEVQDPMETLVKFAKNVTNKKTAFKNALKKKQRKDEQQVQGFKMNKNKNNKQNGNNKLNKNKKEKDPNWGSMTKQQRMEAKAARKIEKVEKKRLKMALKM